MNGSDDFPRFPGSLRGFHSRERESAPRSPGGGGGWGEGGGGGGYGGDGGDGGGGSGGGTRASKPPIQIPVQIVDAPSRVVRSKPTGELNHQCGFAEKCVCNAAVQWCMLLCCYIQNHILLQPNVDGYSWI